METCECCGVGTSVDRRKFLERSGLTVLAASAAMCGPAPGVWADGSPVESAVSAAKSSPESLVKVLYDTLSPEQRAKICFAWDHQDSELGLLRTRVSANWDITDYYINDDFYTDDQRAIIRAIFEGIYSPDWHERIDRQLADDSGGFGDQNSIAIFGEPGSDKCEFVLTGRHMTVRCDGNTAEHVAFGGPIFYGHAAETFNESKDHKGNVFWPQALEANKLYEALDGKQQKLALVRRGLPRENRVGFKGEQGKFQGIPVTEFSADQKARVQEVLRKLVEPYRQTDRDEVTACLQAHGGIDACYLAFYQENDIGRDGVWDNWRLEGPSFVWHFRGAPHVHVWVNVADSPAVKLNA